MPNTKKTKTLLYFLYALLFLLGIKTLFHGFPDTERFFAEWMDERITITAIMKFGTLNFAPTQIMHPPLYHYMTFVPIAIFFAIGKTIGLFHDKIDFLRFYFNNTHYFFLIGRLMSYVFFWLSAAVIYKIIKLLYSSTVSHIATLSYLLVPRLIFDFSTTRPETLLFLNTSIFFYFYLRYYFDNKEIKYLFLASFFLGVATATKYNAIYLGVIFLPLLLAHLTHKEIYSKSYKVIFSIWIMACSFIFLGFFICDPYFIIQFNKYYYNLKLYGTEMKYYWKISSDVNHLRQIVSLLYLNIFGFFILIFGAWHLFKRNRKLSFILLFTIMVYEIYFGILFKNCSPVRYLNPLIPIAVLIFSAGVDFITTYKRKLTVILILFAGILIYNYFDIWQGLSLEQTHLQRARAFIEKTIPEFTTICITSNNYLPQLSMTRECYFYLIKTAPTGWENIKGHELTYKNMDREDNFDAFRELRIESLTKSPQYNLIRWDKAVKTSEAAPQFLKTNNIKYIISNGPGSKELEYKGIVTLIQKFEPRNKRIYMDPCGDANMALYLYKVN